MCRALNLALVLAAVLSGLAGARAQPIEVDATALALNVEDRAQTRVGRLEYLGGLRLSSPDPRFGGLSGLSIDERGERLVAVSDHGFWFTAHLVSDARGAPRALARTQLAPLLAPDGTPVREHLRDAEAVERDADGGYLVSFERVHRLWRYGPAPGLTRARGVRVPTPPALATAPGNGGLEALAVLGPGRWLLVTEALPAGQGAVMGWLVEDGSAEPLAYATRNFFQPTDLTVLPGGDVLALERRYTPISGPGARLVRIPAASIRAGARLEGEELARLVPPLTVDNMEGLATRQREDGATLLYLLSDDNYNRLLQATLLMVFRLAE